MQLALTAPLLARDPLPWLTVAILVLVLAGCFALAWWIEDRWLH